MSSIDSLGSFALLPVGYGIAGWATDQIGAAMVCVIGGALTVVLTALGLTHHTIRDLG